MPVNPVSLLCRAALAVKEVIRASEVTLGRIIAAAVTTRSRLDIRQVARLVAGCVVVVMLLLVVTIIAARSRLDISKVACAALAIRSRLAATDTDVNINCFRLTRLEGR